MEGGGRSSDSRLPLRRLPEPGLSGVVAEGISSYSGGTVPDSHRVPSPFARIAANIARVVLRWLAVVVWAGVIFALSSIPSLSTHLGTWDTILRKGAHMTEYAILAVLLARASGSRPAAFVLAVAYACSDEWHQTFVRGRHGSPIDVGIDAVGVLIGLTLLARTRFAVDGARRGH
jgi:VanZ family protein